MVRTWSHERLAIRWMVNPISEDKHMRVEDEQDGKADLEDDGGMGGMGGMGGGMGDFDMD